MQPVAMVATQGTVTSGFPVPVARLSDGPQAPELKVMRDIPLQNFAANAGAVKVNFTIPADTFVHTDAKASVTLVATLVDGTSLPNWLLFDGNKGEFRGNAPPGFKGVLQIKVIARDDAGKQAETTVRIQVGVSSDRLAEGTLRGKPALAAQLREQGPFAWKAERDRMVQHARSLAAARGRVA